MRVGHCDGVSTRTQPAGRIGNLVVAPQIGIGRVVINGCDEQLSVTCLVTGAVFRSQIKRELCGCAIGNEEEKGKQEVDLFHEKLRFVVWYLPDTKVCDSAPLGKNIFWGL